ncbi:ComF family protein [Castellaniella sp.]|uniref:ComF family protein n=1 Tax=Castellaniella sp. TaxID=1955812 RepID=UPI002AFE4B2C|nr:phosphoribosyltransferase family protein [Castellaniella sp.]
MRHLAVWRDWRHWVPAECPGCERRMAGQGLCAACAGALAMDWHHPRCLVCLHPLAAGICPDCPPSAPAYDRIVAAFDYQDLGRRLVQDYKIRCRLSLAGVLAEQLACAVRRSGMNPDADPDWIVPVPARRPALRERGFSPPAEIARLLARRLGIPCHLTAVRRRQDGRKQAALRRADRLQAQQGLYVCDESSPLRGERAGHWRPAANLAGARVAVIDDVLTTGATMQAVAAALKAAGVARVEGWVLARAVRQAAQPGP